MEDVLDVYHRPYDERRPLVCLDEASKQLVGETVEPIPAAPGQPERFDYEYVRNGTAKRAVRSRCVTSSCIFTVVSSVCSARDCSTTRTIRS